MSYEPIDLEGPYATVFDVGAFQGTFALACLAEWPECQVHSFEPLTMEPDEVTDEPRWSWHPCALGNECDIVTMNASSFEPSSSMLRMAELHERAFPYSKGSREIRVGMATVEEFAEFIVEPALLKIDVQGYELEVLKGAKDWVSAFSGIVLEVSHELLYHGAPSPEALAEWLTLHGLEHKRTVDRLYHPKLPHLLLQSDELWVRP